ncbi:alpha/beta fold hydrolase [Catenulispora yoronensis]
MRNTMDLFRSLADRPEDFAQFAMLTAFSRRYLQEIGRPAVDELARAFASTPGRARQLDAVRHAIRHDGLSGLIPRITAPTLVIGCADDGLVPVRNAKDLHAAIPGSRYAELDSGHVARIERPEELVAVVREFLA